MFAEIKKKMETNNQLQNASPKSRSDIQRLYIKGENGGKVLIQLELIHKITTLGLKKYLVQHIGCFR